LCLVYIITGMHKFSKNKRSHLRNLGARMETWRTLRSGDPNITKHCIKFSCQADLLPGICAIVHAKGTIQKTYKDVGCRASIFEHL